MFAKVHTPKSMPKGSNKGSSSTLINYLEKENNDKEVADSEHFFSHSKDDIVANEAIDMIDKNNKNLGKNDAKFYMVSLNPSEREQRHLATMVAGREIKDPSELTDTEKENFMRKLKDFTNGAMSEYAKNFHRENVKDAKDLVYVAKVETQRTFKHDDKDVIHNNKLKRSIYKFEADSKINPSNKKENDKNIEALKANFKLTASGELIRKGLKKEGFNFHVHVVVSRNNAGQNTKLSPFANGIGKQQFNGKETMRGFHHMDFKEKVGEVFNEKFNYKPLDWEKVKNSNSYARGEYKKGRSTTKQVASMLDPTRNVKGYAKGLANELLTSNQLSTERQFYNQTVQTAKNISMALTNPKSAVISTAKQLISKILSVAKEHG